MEYLHIQRDSTSVNPTTIVVTNVDVVTTSTTDVVATIETPVETVVPTVVNQPIFPSASNRLAADYPWGIPPKFASQFANGGAFIPHQALDAPSAARNYAFPWGIHLIQSPQTVDAGNPRNIQGQVDAETPDDDAEYRGPHLHFQIPS